MSQPSSRRAGQIAALDLAGQYASQHRIRGPAASAIDSCGRVRNLGPSGWGDSHLPRHKDDAMNGDTGGSPHAQRRAGLLADAVAGTAMLAAACGGGGSPAAGGPGTYQKALAYAQCMRSHGEPGWPGATSQGTFSTSQINVDSPQFSPALSACGRPPAGLQIQLSAAQQQELLDQLLRHAACMRAHGITDFPDPSPQDIKDGGMAVSIAIPHRIGRAHV